MLEIVEYVVRLCMYVCLYVYVLVQFFGTHQHQVKAAHAHLLVTSMLVHEILLFDCDESRFGLARDFICEQERDRDTASAAASSIE